MTTIITISRPLTLAQSSFVDVENETKGRASLVMAALTKPVVQGSETMCYALAVPNPPAEDGGTDLWGEPEEPGLLPAFLIIIT